MYAMSILKGMGVGAIIVTCLFIIRYVWGVQFDLERVLNFMFGLAPIAFGFSVVCYIALKFIERDE